MWHLDIRDYPVLPNLKTAELFSQCGVLPSPPPKVWIPGDYTPLGNRHGSRFSLLSLDANLSRDTKGGPLMSVKHVCTSEVASPLKLAALASHCAGHPAREEVTPPPPADLLSPFLGIVQTSSQKGRKLSQGQQPVAKAMATVSLWFTKWQLSKVAI